MSDPIPRRSYTCLHCLQGFPSATDLVAHMAERHPRKVNTWRRIKRWWTARRDR